MKRRPPRRGFLLIIVLIVVMVLALGAYAFSELMMSHQEATQLAGKQIQCRVMTDSVIESVRMHLALDKAAQREAGGNYDNPAMWRGLLVVDDPDYDQRGRCSIISPALDDEGYLGGMRAGLENESTRLNLNALLSMDKQIGGSGRQLLMSLPGCTQEIADAILDWLDEDDDPREYGAEVDHYSGLTPPYAPKNGPLDTVEELLLVRGITPQLMFGMDVNRNGMVDNFEQTGAETSVTTTNEGLEALSALTGETTAITVEGDLSRGWSPYLTLYSMERNVNAQGKPRVFLNQTDMAKLHRELTAIPLPPEWVTFIVAYKQNGPYTSTNTDEKSQPASAGQLDLTKKGNTKLLQVLDLIGKKTRVKFQGSDETIIMDSPFPSELIGMALTLPGLMDNCTVSKSPIIPGRINVNQASMVVLAGIPGMTQEVLTEIISRRNFEPPEELPNRRFETWLLAEAIVTLPEMQILMPFITCGGDVHRAQVIGYYQDGSASARTEVVWDAATNANPRLLFWRDLSHLGRGFALETLGVELQEGEIGP